MIPVFCIYIIKEYYLSRSDSSPMLKMCRDLIGEIGLLNEASASNFSMKEDPISEYGFSSRNNSLIQEKLSLLDDIMRSTLQELNQVREELLPLLDTLENCQPKLFNLVSVDSSSPDYFSEIAEDPCVVKTIFTNATVAATRKVFEERRYPYMMRDCGLLGTKHNNMTAINSHYNTTCYDSTTAWQPYKLPLSSFDISLPPKHQHPHDAVILTFLHVIRNGIVDGTGNVYTGSSKVIPQKCQFKKSPAGANTSTPVADSSHREVFTAALRDGGGFFHDIADHIPRLVPYLTFLRQHPSIKVHLGRKINHDRLLPYLEMAGVSEERIVVGIVHGDLVYSPRGSTCALAPIFNLNYQSLLYRSWIRVSPEMLWSIVIIQRSKKRWFRYHEKLKQSLERLGEDNGFYVEVFSDTNLPGLNETMAMFNRAFLVLAPHGAGNVNMLYSEPGTVLVEGKCLYHEHKNPFNSRYFVSLSMNLGHRYYGVNYPPHEKDCFDFTLVDILPPVFEAIKILKGSVIVRQELCTLFY